MTEAVQRLLPSLIAKQVGCSVDPHDGSYATNCARSVGVNIHIVSPWKDTEEHTLHYGLRTWRGVGVTAAVHWAVGVSHNRVAVQVSA